MEWLATELTSSSRSRMSAVGLVMPGLVDAIELVAVNNALTLEAAFDPSQDDELVAATDCLENSAFGYAPENARILIGGLREFNDAPVRITYGDWKQLWPSRQLRRAKEAGLVVCKFTYANGLREALDTFEDQIDKEQTLLLAAPPKPNTRPKSTVRQRLISLLQKNES